MTMNNDLWKKSFRFTLSMIFDDMRLTQSQQKHLKKIQSKGDLVYSELSDNQLQELPSKFKKIANDELEKLMLVNWLPKQKDVIEYYFKVYIDDISAVFDNAIYNETYNCLGNPLLLRSYV